MKQYIESLNWRYATKKYDTTRKVSAEDIESLKEAVRLSVSSMGLQPYKVLIIENPEVREQLKPAANNQASITEASHLFVFATETNVGEGHIDAYISNISKTREIEKGTLKPFENMMNGYMNTLSEEKKSIWAAKQAYIALSTLINTAPLLKIDATPMEGFNAQQFDEILGLDKLGLHTAVIATVGYRHEEDPFQHLKKVRKPNEELFITI
jgi:nitroreductase